MKPSTICKRFIVPLVLPYFVFFGCSAIGYMIGQSSNPGTEGRVISGLGLDSIALGTDVKVVRYDHSAVVGSYDGLSPYPPRLYRARYDTLVARSGYRGFVPKLNQWITLTAGGKSSEGAFKGIDFGELLFQRDMALDTTSVPLEDVDCIQAFDSLRLEGPMLLKLVRAGTMPGRHLILLQSGGDVLRIPYESVEIIVTQPTNSGALTGLLIGAAIDVTVAIVIVVSMNEAADDCNRGCTSGANNNQSCNRR